MKTTVIPRLFLLLVLGACTQTVVGADTTPLSQRDSAGLKDLAERILHDTWAVLCYNPPYREPSGGGTEIPENCDCCKVYDLKDMQQGVIDCTGTSTKEKSWIDNINYSYHHFANDYFTELDPTTGCQSCGGGKSYPSKLNDLPRLKIVRTHRPRDMSYPSAFGPGVFQYYDVSLQLYKTDTGERYIDFFDPGTDLATRFFDGAWTGNEFGYTDPNDAIYRDLIDNKYKYLKLLDAQGQPTTDHELAMTAVVENYGGCTWYFQIFGNNGIRCGRLLSMSDARGYTISVGYAFQNDNLDGLQSRMWQISGVTDAYGDSAAFHYLGSQVGGRWVVGSIDLPNGTSVSYQYQGDHLSGITYPDGTTSSFGYSYNANAQCTVIDINDAAASTTHRHKKVYVSTQFHLTPGSDGSFMPQGGQLVRMIIDGTGRPSYFNIPHPWATANYVYEGGNAFKYVAFDMWSDLVLYSRFAKTVSFDEAGSGHWFNRVSCAFEAAFRTTGFSLSDQFRSCYRNEAKWSRDETNFKKTYGSFNGGSKFVRRTYPDGTWDEATYEGHDRWTSYTDRLGRVTTMTYDGVGNMTSRTLGPSTEQWIYNAGHRLIAYIDANGHQTDYEYDGRGRLIKVIAPADYAGRPRAETLYEYDGCSRLTKVIQPVHTNWVSVTYDSRSRASVLTYADGSTETSVYGTGSNANLVVRKIDRNGNTTDLGYDLDGRQISSVLAGPPSQSPVQTKSWTYLPGTDKVTSTVDNGDTVIQDYDYRNRGVTVRRQPRGGVELVDQYPFDDMNRPKGHIDPYGRGTWYVYDVNNNIIRKVRDLVVGGVGTSVPSSEPQRSSYLLNLARSTGANPSVAITEATFDAERQVTSTSDGRGVRTDYLYTILGQVQRQTVASGSSVPKVLNFTYDPVGNLLSKDGPRSRTDFTYTARNLLWTVVEAVGSADAATVRTLTYTLNAKVESEKDANNNTTSFTYGPCCDRLVVITDPMGYQASMSYDFVGNRLSATDPNGLVTSMTYDAVNRVTSQTNGAGETTAIAYDDHLGDGAGVDAVPAVQAAIAGFQFSFGRDGSAVATTNPKGETSYQIHDGIGRVVAQVDPLGHATGVMHDAVVNGLVEATTTDPLGHATAVRRDGNEKGRVQVDALGNQHLGGFDANGNQVTFVDAGGVGWSAIYDVHNRMVSRTTTRTDQTEKTQWTYDLDDNRLTETDALNKTETATFDLRNRRIGVQDRLGGITRFTFDPVGNLLQISDAENESRGGLGYGAGSTLYAYDARNLLVAEVFPTGQQGRTLRSYAYDAGRRLTTRKVGILSGAFGVGAAFTTAPEITSYTYDGANRITMRGYADALNDAFAYDLAGRLTGASSSRYATTVARAYDAAGRLTSEGLTLPDGSLAAGVLAPATFTVGYQYAADNQQTGITYPTGTAVVRTYTARHELAGVSAGGQAVANRVYDASGDLITTTLGNGVVEGRSYVPGSPLVASIAAQKTGSAVTGFGYSYDATGRKLGETNSVDVFAAQQFGYDFAGRLTSWVQGLSASPSATQTWNLSLVGDWTSTNRSGVVESRTHTQVHEATQVGGAALSYDAKGNLTVDDKGTALAWDPENRLIAARVTPDVSPSGFGAVASYRYDALGRRIAKTVQNRTTFYLPAGAQTVVEVERSALPPSQAQIDGIEADGTLANMAKAPASGGILSGAVTRVNFQPSTAVIPTGFLADKGKVYATRTNGLSYGWVSDASSQAVERHGAVPLPEFDTFTQALPDSGATNAWSIALPNGSYPVIVVAGDALSTEQTNNLLIGDQSAIDSTPSTAPSYEQGNFDGYATQVTVSNGFLTIAPCSGALRSKLCFIEIGQAGGTISQDVRDRLAALMAKVNAQTGASAEPQLVQKEFFYGSYVDEVLAYTVSNGATTSRYYVSSNHLHSPSAITDNSGVVVERMKYDAYGRQTITSASGVSRSHSAVGFDRGITGYIQDEETGLYLGRSRYFSPMLGRFINRQPWHEVFSEHCGYSPENIDQLSSIFLQSTLTEWMGLYSNGRYNLYIAPNQNVVEPYSLPYILIALIVFAPPLDTPTDAGDVGQRGNILDVVDGMTVPGKLKVIRKTADIIGETKKPQSRPDPKGPPSEKPQRRTPEENKQARNKYKNNKEKARREWEERTGQKWPTDEYGNAWPGEHDPPLKEGGDPMEVFPRDPSTDPHNVPGPDGLTDYQRWGAEGTPAREANKCKSNSSVEPKK